MLSKYSPKKIIKIPNIKKIILKRILTILFNLKYFFIIRLYTGLLIEIDNKKIPIIIDKIPEDMNIELNVSCPNHNIVKKTNNNELLYFLNDKLYSLITFFGEVVLIKLFIIF